MKRLIMLAVLCAFVLGATAASAADIKASGTWVVEANWAANWDMKDKSEQIRGGNKSFGVYQRATTSFQFVANENLKAVMQLRYGTEEWGQQSFAIGQGDNQANTTSHNRITVRQAYVDFMYPDTTINVKAGYQSVGLPAAFGGGSYILDEEVGAALVGGQITDNVSYLVGYARALSGEAASTATTANLHVDAYVAALPMSFEGFAFSPFAVYAPISSNVTGAALTGTKMVGLASVNATGTALDAFDNAYWLGTSFNMDLFDPFVLKADFNYGKVESKVNANERSGWLFDAALEYKGMDFMTPELFFAYTSGEDGNATKGDGSSERMPVLAAQNWAMGSFFFGGDRGLVGSKGNRNDYLGFWALGLSLKDIQSFAEGLTHDAHFIYAQGTNDKNTFSGVTGEINNNVSYGNTLTEDDSLFEIDFNTGYKVYEELTLYMDLGYFNLDTKESRWGDTAGYKGGDAYKITTGVIYKF